MIDPAQAAEITVELGKKHVRDQQDRIARQKELIAEFQRDNHAALLIEAQQQLEKMEQMLCQIEADLAAAQERLVQASVDQKNLDAVERDTPM
jgi:hypothetical protein